MKEARGIGGVLRFDGQTLEIRYESEERGKPKVRYADVDELVDVDFSPATDEPGFVKYTRRHPPPGANWIEFGLRFRDEQESGVRSVSQQIEQALAELPEPEPPKTKKWYHKKRYIVPAVLGIFLLPLVLDPEGFAQRQAEREERRAAERAEELAEQQAADASAQEERRKGFHCLSGWDGSNRSFVQQVERIMRNPDSFEHIETRISPIQDGEHGAWMTFRAENGFGGMNVERMYARIDHETCVARVLPEGPGN